MVAPLQFHEVREPADRQITWRTMMRISLLLMFSFVVISRTGSAQHGAIRWIFESGYPGEHLSSVAIGDDGTIYVSSFTGILSDPGRVYAITPAGRKLWEFLPPAAEVISTAPIIGDNGAIYFSTAGVNFARLFAITNGTLSWVWQDSAVQFLQPAIGTDGTLYFVALYGSALTNQALIALGVDGSLKWRLRLSRIFDYYPSPVIGLDETIYVGTNDRFYAIDPDGTIQWSLALARCRAIIREDGSLLASYQLGGSYYLASMMTDGVPDWITYGSGPTGLTIGPGGIIAAGGAIYFPDGTYFGGGYPGSLGAFSTDRVFYTIRRPDVVGAYMFAGGPLWERKLQNESTRAIPTLGPDGMLYVGADRGQLYAIQGTCGLANTSWPMERGNPKRDGRPYAGRVIPPCLSAVNLVRNRGLHLVFRGEFGNYRIETSSNLQEWFYWTNVVHTNFITHLTDVSATNAPVRFYRALLTP